MSATVDLSFAEQRAYELVVSSDSLYQSELWKALDVSSRQGSRIARSLADRDLIERERTVHDGRVTYRLTPAEDESSDTVATDLASVDTEDEVSGAHHEDLKPREQRALSLIQRTGGLYQSEFWKELGVSSRTGSRIATNLEDKQLIRRQEATYNGQRTYLLLPTKKDLDFSLLMAGDMISPLIGNEGDVDPIDSETFTQWILQLPREER